MYTIRGLVGNIFMRLCGLLPLQDKIVFSSFNGKSFSDNPRAIYEEIRSQYGDKYKYIWLMQDKKVKISGVKVVKFPSLSEAYHLATAKLWIDNVRKRNWIVKRKGQYYVQTWHGDLALKKIELDAADKLDTIYVNDAKHDSQIADLFISACKWSTDNFREAFWYDGKILEYGTPRSEILYKQQAPIRKKVIDSFGLNGDVKLLLYVPTFRNADSYKSYTIDYKKTVQALKQKFGGEWKVLVRFHPNINEKANLDPDIDYVINATDYEVTNELIAACDILITDYSSCMFDGMQAKKKVFLYASDIDEYNGERGMYFSFEELPFSLAQTNEQLEKNIIDFDEDKYIEEVHFFMNRINFFNNENSSRRVTEYIMKNIR